MGDRQPQGEQTDKKAGKDLEIQIVDGEPVMVSAFQTKGKWSTFAGGNAVYHNIEAYGEYEPLMTLQALQIQAALLRDPTKA
ncbi:MAG: hypothetical protein KDJ75_04285 [Alphaproteobacteria bacterium]|nr:hypothetical protein [Alphaproteobacteria bacterium]